MVRTYKVGGMTCGGCVRSVEQAIKAVAPDVTIKVDLAGGSVTVNGAEETAVAKAIDDAGFDFLGAA